MMIRYTNPNESCWFYVKNWVLMTIEKKSLYLNVIPSIFDQASDIAMIYEYYSLSKNAEINEYINALYLFYISLLILILSRMISGIAIYGLTRNIFDIILGAFDLLWVKSIYIAYKLKRKDPTNIQRYIGLLQSTLESLPQLLVSLLYATIMASNRNVNINPIIIISLISSLYSLTKRVIDDDSNIVYDDWKRLDINIKSCPVVNIKYIFRVVFRFIEISSKLILYVLMWINIGPLFTGIIIVCEFAYLIILAIVGGSIEIIGNIVYFIVAFNNERYAGIVSKMYIIYAIFRVFASYMILVYISLMMKYKNVFSYGLLIYCWLTHFVWTFVYVYLHNKFGYKRDSRIELFKLYKNNGINIARGVNTLIKAQNINGFIDVISFGADMNSYESQLYITLMTAKDANNHYIFDGNARNKGELLSQLFKQKSLTLTDKEYNILKWDHNTNMGGYIRIHTDCIFINKHAILNATQSGYYGNNIHNIGKGEVSQTNNTSTQMGYPGYVTDGAIDTRLNIKGGNVYSNPELNGYLYHGSGKLLKRQAGGGTIILIAENNITIDGDIKSNGFSNYYGGTGGTIFICCKIFENNGNIQALSKDNNSSHGRIAIYCNEYINNGNIKPKPYIGKYIHGLDIINKRALNMF